jgi:hypothetical protein
MPGPARWCGSTLVPVTALPVPPLPQTHTSALQPFTLGRIQPKTTQVAEEYTYSRVHEGEEK